MWVQSLGWEDPLEKEMAPIFLPGKSHGQRSLAGHSPRGCKEVDPTWPLNNHHFFGVTAADLVTNNCVCVCVCVCVCSQGAMLKRRRRSCSVVSDSLLPHGLEPTRLLHQWDFPGKSTGVVCHFLLQGIFLTQELNLGLPHCRQTLLPSAREGAGDSYRWVLGIRREFFLCLCNMALLHCWRLKGMMAVLFW